MPEPRERRLAAIDVRPGAAMESQSGLQMLRPRIYGAYEEASLRSVPARARRIGAIVMHPTSNFMGHYLIGPLAQRGIACLGLNSRFAGNDTVLVMERVLQDLGAGVKFMRESLACDRVVLVGNSGGAALAAYYQAEAERFTAETLVDGDRSGIVAADLPPVDGIALCAAHEGRSHLLLRWIDPSVVDEHDALAVEPSLDMYDPRHWIDGAEAPPRYRPEFLARFAAAQRARRDRIEARVRARLVTLRAVPGGSRDEAFIVHRTHADPRCLDLTLDPNDRRPGSVWGDARAVNYSANAMGRTTSLTAFLSQWSSASRAGGPENLARTSLPVLLLTYTADQSTFPSTRDAWLAAAPGRIRNVDVVGGDHYLAGRLDLQLRVADEIAAFAEAL
ncbi:MAG: alpha/beta hydrolase family protein [Caldimonas sp.]